MVPNLCITRETNKYLFGVPAKSSNVIVVVVMVVRQPAGQPLQMAAGMHRFGETQ